jgi:hypothetical protein
MPRDLGDSDYIRRVEKSFTKGFRAGLQAAKSVSVRATSSNDVEDGADDQYWDGEGVVKHLHCTLTPCSV